MSKQFNNFKDMNQSELEAKLKELRLELVKLNAQRQSSINSKVASQIRKTRKDIARILTLLNMKKGLMDKQKITNRENKRNK